MGVLKRLVIVGIVGLALAQFGIAILPFRSVRALYDALFWLGIFATIVACGWASCAIHNPKRPTASALAVFSLTCLSSVVLLFIAVERGVLTLWLFGNGSLKLVA